MWKNIFRDSTFEHGDNDGNYISGQLKETRYLIGTTILVSHPISKKDNNLTNPRKYENPSETYFKLIAHVIKLEMNVTTIRLSHCQCNKKGKRNVHKQYRL